MAGNHRRRASSRARRRHRGVATDRRRPRQLRPGSRVARRSRFGYDHASRRDEIRNLTEGKPMTREIFWLTLTVIMTGLLWVPYVLNRCQVRGLGGAMANPARNDKPHAEWANRLMFAHDNAVEN